MSCLLTTGIAKGCRDNTGGIRSVYITNIENITATTPSPNNPGLYGTPGTPADVGVITGFTMVATKKFYKFVPNKTSSNWTETIQSNLQNGTIGYEQALKLIFAKNEAAKRNQIKLLGQGTLCIIVHDYNDKYWLLGEMNGLELASGTSSSGTALSDLNGWDITLQGMEHYPAREVDPALITSTLVDIV